MTGFDTSKPDYRGQRAVEILRLARALQASHFGLSAEAVAEVLYERQGKARPARRESWMRAVRRALDSVSDTFDHALVKREIDGEARWRLPIGTVDSLIQVSAEDTAAVTAAVRLLEQANRPDDAERLRGLAESLRALLPSGRPGLETDIAALLTAEGIAFTPGPRANVDANVVHALRHAILGCRKVRLRHYARAYDTPVELIAHAYGLLWGKRNYLVAFSERAAEIRLFALSRIEQVTVLEDAYEPPADFDLRAWTSEYFGLYRRDEPADIRLRFTDWAAEEVHDYVLHPSQRLESDGDDTLVHLHCGGFEELCWHLFTWGDLVRIEAPDSLRQTYRNLLTAALDNVEREED